MAGKYELYQDKGGNYRWRLRHQNGNVIADSGEGYSSKAAAINGIESVKNNVAEADIKDLSAPEPEAAPEPAPVQAEVKPEQAPAAPEAKPKPTAKYELYQDKGGEYRWRLRHQNGNIIADSGEGYSSKAAAINGIESVKNNVALADVKDLSAPAPEVAPEPTPVQAEVKQEPTPVQAEVKQEPTPTQAEVKQEPTPIQAETKQEPVARARNVSGSASGRSGEGDNSVVVIAVVILAVFFVCAIGIIFTIAGVR